MEKRWEDSNQDKVKAMRLKVPKAKLKLVDNPVFASVSGKGHVTVTDDTGRVRELYSVTVVASRTKWGIVTIDLRQPFKGNMLAGDLKPWEYEFHEMMKDPAAGRFDKIALRLDRPLRWTKALKKMTLSDFHEMGIVLELQPSVRKPESPDHRYAKLDSLDHRYLKLKSPDHRCRWVM